VRDGTVKGAAVRAGVGTGVVVLAGLAGACGFLQLDMLLIAVSTALRLPTRYPHGSAGGTAAGSAA
jgi:hypothetical protein